MTNYEYIIASLPVLDKDSRNITVRDCETVLEEILSQATASDKALIEFLQRGSDPAALEDEAFWKEALCHKDAFIRRYFTWDLCERNAKVRHINAALGRDAGQDLMSVEGFVQDDALASSLDALLATEGLLEREKAIDDARWEMIEDAVVMEVFSIDVVLSFIARMEIVERWLKLDRQKGQDMFRSLVNEVRGTFGGVKFEDKKK